MLGTVASVLTCGIVQTDATTPNNVRTNIIALRFGDNRTMLGVAFLKV